MNRDIENKKIELFVENGIDKYRRCDDIKLMELIKVFLDNNGFIIFMNKDSKFIGYLDLADIEIIKKFFMEKEDKSKKISDFIKENKINLRKEKIDSDTPLIDVLKKLDTNTQNYFPVFRGDILLGRISKIIISDKIKDLY